MSKRYSSNPPTKVWLYIPLLPHSRYLSSMCTKYFIGVATLYNSAQYFGSWSYNDNYYYTCSDTSSSLTSCNRSTVSSSSFCNSNDHAGLWCMTVPPAGSVRAWLWNWVVIFSIHSISVYQWGSSTGGRSVIQEMQTGILLLWSVVSILLFELSSSHCSLQATGFR